jgi:hypothetical protein
MIRNLPAKIIILALFFLSLIRNNIAVCEEIKLTSEWTIVVGKDSLEMQAGNDFKKKLSEKYNITLQGPIIDSFYKNESNAIFIGTIKDHICIEKENFRNSFTLDIKEPESYHCVFRNADNNYNLWIAGTSPKGAMNGVYRFLDRNILTLNGLSEAKTPVFKLRVGGHKMNQYPPADWTEEKQAAYYAQHYINVIWGEKKGAPLSYEARRKYGLGLMLEAKFPPKDGEWMTNPSNSSAVCQLNEKENARVIDPFDPTGRQAYLDLFIESLRRNPDTKIFYGIFGDYSRVPSEHSIRLSDHGPYTHTREEVIKEIMLIMKEAIGDKDIIPMVWLWHAFFGEDGREKKFMKEMASQNYGIIYNEAGNNDNWVFKRDNFDKSAIETDAEGKTVFGERYMPLVSAGGACESINPVIGLPLPAVATYKIQKLYDIKVKNFVLWWGSVEGWVYQANMEVIKEMIWNPGELNTTNTKPLDPVNPDPLLKKIAVRDFGHELAADILRYWQMLDKALVTDAPIYLPPDSHKRPGPKESGLQIYSWWQRLGTYTEAAFGGAYPQPLTAHALSKKEKFKNIQSWGANPFTISNYEEVINNLNLVNAWGEEILNKKIQEDVKCKIQNMHDYVGILTCIFTSQYNHFRGLRIMKDLPGVPPDAPLLKERLLTVIYDELKNIEQYKKVIRRFPDNFNIRLGMSDVVSNRGNKYDEISFLDKKAKAMIEYLDENPVHYSNFALANSTKISFNGNSGNIRNIIDDNTDTFLEGKLEENKILISFEKPVKVESIILKWGKAIPLEYKIDISVDGKKWENIIRQIPLNIPVSVNSFNIQDIRYLRIIAIGNIEIKELQIYGGQN